MVGRDGMAKGKQSTGGSAGKGAQARRTRHEPAGAARNDSLLQRRLWRLNLALALAIFLILAILWIGIELGAFPAPDEASARIMEQADLMAILVFGIELYSEFRRAEDKKVFLKTHWMEVIVLLPIGTVVRMFRAAEGLEVFAGIRKAAELEKFPMVVPEVTIIGKSAAQGAVRLHQWLCHYTVFSDFSKEVVRLKRRFA